MGHISLKRVNKELDDFYSEKYFSNYSKNIQKYFRSLNIQVYIINNDFNEYYNLKITNKNNNKTLLECYIPNSYPFKPYVVTKFKAFNNTSKIGYYKYLSLINSKNTKIYDTKILDFFYKLQYGCKSHFLKLSDTSCFCCSSITCSHNWTPSFKIDNILLEYLEAQFIVNYNQPYNYLNLLNTYYGVFELFDFYKLPNEIVEIILSHF
tara:strand:- start:371 stop:994 length:624 start_codon:yes stop_codon:yes gene_type:complete